MEDWVVGVQKGRENALNDPNSQLPPIVPPNERYQPGGSTSLQKKIYGAPRVFDLFTLLAITLAFAMLFTLLGLLAPAMDASATSLTMAVGGFVTLVGLAQMWLFGSKNPRLASLIGGPLAMLLLLILAVFLDSSSWAWASAILASTCVSICVGPVCGYLAGAVVAGVFLVADGFRQYFLPTTANDKDARFDEIE